MEFGLVALWLAAYLALGAAALPVAALLFPRFADRGAGLAVPLALALLGVPAFWVGHVAFGPPALAAGLLALLGGSVVALRRGHAPVPRAYVAPAAVFALAFFGMVAVRAVDPAAHPGGGEKFLDLGLLSSLARSPVLPPEDMWFAGEPVQYYYGGHMVAAVLVELTGTPPEYAYNLALSGYYGALAVAAFGLARAVAARRDVAPNVAGGLAAGLVVAASNAGPPLRLLAFLLPGGTDLAERLEFARGRFDSETIAHGLEEFSYWDASGGYGGGITEFPLFAWLNGDLHAHMMGTPLLVLLAAVLYNYYLTPAASVWRRRALLFGAVPALGGLMAVVNTWSFPTVAGLTALAVTFAPASPGTLAPAALRRLGGRVRAAVGAQTPPVSGWAARLAAGLETELRRNAGAAAVAGLVAGLTVLGALPFFLGAVGGSGERSLGLLPDRTGLAGLVVVHGGFLVVSAAYLVGAVASERDWTARHWLAAGGVVAVLLWLAFPHRLTAVVLFGSLLLAGWWLLRREQVGYETVLAVAAFGLVLAVEFLYLQEEAGPGRMNTMFKLYMQVWVLWATASGVMLAAAVDLPGAWTDLRADAGRALARVLPGPAAAPVRSPDGGPLRFPRRRNAGAVLAVLFLLSLSVYGGIALYAHAERVDGPATLDSTAFVHERHPEEADAIEWVDRLEGQPTIVTAPGTAIYQWVNAPSSLTGVPTVAGWIHETGYRDPDAYYARVSDVAHIFEGGAAERARLLRQYDVAYVYVGPEERERYALAAIGDDPGIEAVFRTSAVTIYAVNQSELVESGPPPSTAG